ncbi:metallophosphoesterase [archaeon]|nr:MAG: metallophosphoesterase [archaeon]
MITAATLYHMSSFASSVGESTAEGWCVVCISDTHNREGRMPILPMGDVLVHAGDFSNVGREKEIESFMKYFTSQPHPIKILIAGNHDITMNTDYYEAVGAYRFHHRNKANKGGLREHALACQSIIKKACDAGQCVYMEDSLHTIPHPIRPDVPPLRVYGSPWQPEFCEWAFNLPIGRELTRKWDAIPNDIDMLVTHGPPWGVLDASVDGTLCGCPNLRQQVMTRIQPRLHVFGHIHEGYGTCILNKTLYINASTCNYSYAPLNPPVVVHIPFDRNLCACAGEVKSDVNVCF